MQNFCFHIHTPRCGHADDYMAEDLIARYFYEAGFKTIAFTDHCPWKTTLEKIPNHSMRWNQRYEYLDSIHSLAKQYEGRMKILAGYECEYLPQNKEEMDILRKESEIIIVGQHFTNDKDGKIIRLHDKDYVPTGYELDFYAQCLIDACKTHFADVIAHPDLFMIHKTEFGKEEAEISHRICQAAEENNVPVEINLCLPSIKLFVDENRVVSYPCRDFWNIAKEYNLKTIFGLDFHGRFNPCHHNEVVDLACKIIGEDILSKLHICSTSADLT